MSLLVPTELRDAEVLRLLPGDIIVFRHDKGAMSEATISKVRDFMENAAPQCKVMLVEKGIEINVLRPPEENDAEQPAE